jgi:hypothetical protein
VHGALILDERPLGGQARASAVTFSSISASEGVSVIGAALVILMLVGAGRWWALCNPV